MTPVLPAVGLVILGVGLAVAGVTMPMHPAPASGPVARLVVPASVDVARSVTVGLGGLNAFGGVTLLGASAGWSR